MLEQTRGWGREQGAPGSSPTGSREPSTTCSAGLLEREDPEAGARWGLNEQQDQQDREGRSEGLLRIRQEHPRGLGTNSNRPQIQSRKTVRQAGSSALGSTQTRRLSIPATSFIISWNPGQGHVWFFLTAEDYWAQLALNAGDATICKHTASPMTSLFLFTCISQENLANFCLYALCN